MILKKDSWGGTVWKSNSTQTRKTFLRRDRTYKKVNQIYSNLQIDPNENEPRESMERVGDIQFPIIFNHLKR